MLHKTTSQAASISTSFGPSPPVDRLAGKFALISCSNGLSLQSFGSFLLGVGPSFGSCRRLMSCAGERERERGRAGGRRHGNNSLTQSLDGI
jgi:hypothetical protein